MTDTDTPDDLDDDTVDAGDEPDDAADCDDAGEPDESVDDLRGRIRSLERALARAKKRAEKSAADQTPPAPDPAAEAREALERANRKILHTEARAHLVAAGLPADAAKVAVRMLDLGGVEVGDDGDVDEDEIVAAVDELRQTLPQLFAAAGDSSSSSSTGEPRRAGKVNTSRGGKTTQRPLSTEEKLLLAAGYELPAG